MEQATQTARESRGPYGYVAPPKMVELSPVTVGGEVLPSNSETIMQRAKDPKVFIDQLDLEIACFPSKLNLSRIARQQRNFSGPQRSGD